MDLRKRITTRRSCETHAISVTFLPSCEITGLAKIRTATLVISGAHDPATPPADGHFLAQQIPGARYVELNAAHLSNIEDQARFNNELAAFLNS